MRPMLAIAVLVTTLALSALWLSPTSEAAVGPFGEAKVRLYSNGVVVGEWLAVGRGRVEGDTFVFPVRKGSRDMDVRISGTFSFEEQP